ncbi:HesB/IscA family protein [Legionella oakridgensis]|uniref:Iron-sulfur cluster assembly accessory protein n=2 Tax=Legionella oakridgensis TaxID=29423 RepID=W0BCS9_9GAMM|nr:iron-sulfur cluster assembly accessory protein [Legionella oakridgensis]AHE67675.1 iron-sulfur cluster assembly accessory protein [Legionella oakridgensis ATCC 33761 = DSM 21215]ETO92770.1 iron-sulfur cluster assembly accessory protein [Legionella oakridgensis RV-2-2007]KTD36991.1 Fe-S cluster assembly protein [Legionella oakridgensis]STY20700.1 Fe-S cluster assembly protein [Legionella longbeachae]
MSDVIQHVNDSEQRIDLTEAAMKHVLSYLTKQNGKGIRLSVKKTGCSGLSYVVDYVQSPAVDDIVLPLIEDYVICIDRRSYPYLKGTQVDYVKQGLNHKFIFYNPNQTGQCGCGESFTVD